MNPDNDSEGLAHTASLKPAHTPRQALPPTLPDGPEGGAEVSPSERSELILSRGATLGGYEVIRPLGRGGMGAVYLARDPRLGRHVAIKVMTSADPEFAARLLVEARATARCNHENIVVIHGADEYEGHPFLVLERLEGRSLAEIRDAAGPMDPERAAEIALGIGRALVHAHALDIAHRDLKPGNVFVTRSGVVKVLDFGLAKAIPARTTSMPPSGSRPSPLPGRSVRPWRMSSRPSMPTDPSIPPISESELTEVGHVVGTIQYMAPEQLRGDPIDGRADLFSLGALLHELVAGHHLLGRGTGTPRLYAAANGIVAMPSASELSAVLPADLARVVARCCAFEPGDRYPSAKALVAELEELLADRARAELGEDEAPYPGLSTFGVGRAEVFFGRGGDARRAQARLENHPLLVVAGPSGVGKSSLVHAGLVPELTRTGEGWRVMRVRPGRHPLENLASLVTGVTGQSATAEIESFTEDLRDQPGLLAMRLREHARRHQGRVLVVVDQLEELWTLGAELESRLAFTAALGAIADDVASPLRVVATIRSDFVDRVAEDPEFRDRVTEGLMLLAPLGPEDLRSALVEPAALMGYAFEGDFVSEIIDELADNPGALPLMQFTAAKLWDARDRERRLLTEASYRSLGGIEGALASHADAVFDELPREIREEAGAVLIRLVTPERTRAIASMAELSEPSEHPERARALVEALVRARLLVAHGEGEETTVEIAHEALITRWPRLSEWLDTEREDVVARQQLREAARQWDERGRDPGLLWGGDALRDVAHLHRRGGGLSGRERAFLEAAVRLSERGRRIRRMGFGLLLGAALAIAAGAIIALIAIGGAEREARDAAELARDEAERALAAEQHASSAAERAERERQQREQAERSAEASAQQVVERDETLQETNVRLEVALEEARSARDRARSEARRAQAEADRAQGAERSVRDLLQERERRVRELERRLSQISTELR